MGRQQRWADIDRIIEAQLACDLQHFLFGLGVEAVSRLISTVVTPSFIRR
jgi:hypothetical protein